VKLVKPFRILSCAVVLALIAMPTFPGDQNGPGGGQGQGVCRTEGAWIGEAPDFGIGFMAIYDAVTYWWGTVDLTWIGGDPTFLNSFPNAVAFSAVKGQWHRTGRRTFEYTMISYGLDALGQPVYIAKNSGWKRLLPGCRSSEIEGAIELYAPDQDPFGDDPPMYGCIGPAFATEMRMHIDPPCEPPPPTPTPTPPAP
jgi:hypothetical protein